MQIGKSLSSRSALIASETLLVGIHAALVLGS